MLALAALERSLVRSANCRTSRAGQNQTDAPIEHPPIPAERAVIDDEAGLLPMAARSTSTFWKIACAFLRHGASFYGVVANVGFILEKSAGLTLGQIAQVQMIFERRPRGPGAFRIHARQGECCDSRNFSRSLSLCPVFCGIWSRGSLRLVSCAAFLGGMSIGGESDLGPYLASRYFGIQNVSNVFGWFLSSFSSVAQSELSRSR